MEKEKYEVFNVPSYIYLPFDTVDKLNLRKTGGVYFSEYLGSLTANYNIYSPVSGRIIGTKKSKVDDKVSNVLVIENDYKDKYYKMKPGKEIFDFYKRKDANELFDLFNIEGKFNGKKSLVVNLKISDTDLENKYIVSKYSYEILETIDAIIKIFSLENAYVMVNDRVLDALLREYSRIYTNIKIVRSAHITESSVLYNGYEIIKIYNALKFNRYYPFKYVSIINKKNVYVVKTKINTVISEILNSLNINYSNVSAILYNNMRIDNYDGILSSNIKTIIVS